jgi:hypothetical protein
MNTLNSIAAFVLLLMIIADALVKGIIAVLGPLDQLLLSLYTVLAVAVTTRVLTKWKTIAFELLLKDERGREQMSLDGYEAENNISSISSRSRNIDSVADMQLAYSSSGRATGSGSSSDRSGAAVGITGVITREGAGGMLSVEMRPRSPTAAAEAAAAAAAMHDDASGDADAQEEGIRERIGPVGGLNAAAAVGGSAAGAADEYRGGGSSRSSSSSSRRQRSGKWFVGKSADDLERLLLPLDGWVTQHTRFIVLQPLADCGQLFGVECTRWKQNKYMGAFNRPITMATATTVCYIVVRTY